ncbi:unnamed protein product [Didymodactylos carnosus]|uniref:Tc1-like transposase DDE domain-containing protein n=1 Tax=Didymodactylos carnosus TaxID=1234261 RepID=A0A813V1N8_9BILA|nr:unnamed protein product [Didymodactylos carnosus]CAF3623156.1 unnamed protein product [Didymodactylos carnosus]
MLVDFQRRKINCLVCVQVVQVLVSSRVGPLVVYQGRVNGARYIDIINQSLPVFTKKMFRRNEKWSFMQDNTPRHKSKFSMARFEMKEMKILECPTTSPDLNSIEKLWDIIDKKLNGVKPTNAQYLEQLIHNICSEIDPTTCQQLVESMLRRLHACISVKGGTSAKS